MNATPAAYFERMWQVDDPWNHTGRWYERRKYDLTAATLPAERYRRGFEPGCGTGLLTGRLADRCDSLVAMDRHPRAVAVTRKRFGGEGRIEVLEGQIPGSWPSGAFDLIVLSELLYYLAADELERVLDLASNAVPGGGTLVAVHYRPSVPEHARTGDEVHSALRARPEWALVASHVEERFILEAFTRR